MVFVVGVSFSGQIQVRPDKFRIIRPVSLSGFRLTRPYCITITKPKAAIYGAHSLHVVPRAPNREFFLLFFRIMPHEEADWHGLSFGEAVHKQLILERLEDEKRVVPLKEIYRKDLYDKLKRGLMDDVDTDLLYETPPAADESKMLKAFKSLTDKIRP